MDKKGAVLQNALPDFFLDDFFDDLSRRVMAMFEAVDSNYLPCDGHRGADGESGFLAHGDEPRSQAHYAKGDWPVARRTCERA